MEHLAILVLSLLVLFFVMRNHTWKNKYKDMKKGKEDLQSTLTFYISAMTAFKDTLLMNNIPLPSENIFGTVPEDEKLGKNDKKNEQNYNVDDILDEIAAKGIKNISKSKIDFLNKHNNK